MTEKKTLKRGYGRCQIILCQARIKELIAQGYDIRKTYEALCDEGLITMSYGGFYDLVTQRKRKKKIRMMLVAQDETPLYPQEPLIEPLVPSKVNLKLSGSQPVPTSNAEQLSRRKNFSSTVQQNVVEVQRQANSSSELEAPVNEELANKHF